MTDFLKYLIGFFVGLLVAIYVIFQRPSVDTIVAQAVRVAQVVNNGYLDPIVKEGGKFSDVVMAQFALESRYGESDRCKKSGNGFGMKPNDNGFSKGTYKDHADYGGDLNLSIKDYVVWQKKHLKAYEEQTGKKVKTDEEYIKFLGDLRQPWRNPQNPTKRFRYAEDPEYEDKLRSILPYVKKARQFILEKKQQELKD